VFCVLALLSCSNPKHQDSATSNITGQIGTKPMPTSSNQIGKFVVTLFEDSKGYLWFGTMSNGVARYDGKTLTFFNDEDGLVGNTVTAIAEDKDGVIWLGTHSGLSRYDGQSFQNFTSKQGLCFDQVSNILFDKTGQLWIGAWGGVCKYVDAQFEAFPLPSPDIEVPYYQETADWVTVLMEDRKGNIWFGRSGLGACRYDGTTFTHFTKKEGLLSNCVQEIQEDLQGNFWFGTRVAEKDHPNPTQRSGAGGLSRFDGKSFTHFKDKEGLSENDVYAIYLDKKGHLWIGANGLGAYQYDGKTFKLYKGTDRMDLTYCVGIQSILEDRNGVHWFGFSGGLFRLEDTAIVNVTVADF